MGKRCAEFDERYFPGLKRTPLTPEPFEPIVPSIFTPTLDSGGDEESDTNPIQENHSPSPDLANVQNPLPALPIPLLPIPDAPIPLPDVPATPPTKMEQIEPVTPPFHRSSSPEPESSPELPIALQHTKHTV